MRLSHYKNIVLPVGATVVVVIVGLFIGSSLISQINSIVSETTDQEAKNEVLKERVATLSTLTEEIRTSANEATIALPDKSPSVLIVSQLKSAAEANSIILSNLSISSGVSPESIEEIVSHEVNFNVAAADYASLSNFVIALSQVKPILNLNTLKIDTDEGNGIQAEIKLSGFSSPFPAELPALDQSISELSAEEQQTLDLVETFASPAISTGGGEPEVVEPRADPFTLSL